MEEEEMANIFYQEDCNLSLVTEVRDMHML